MYVGEGCVGKEGDMGSHSYMYLQWRLTMYFLYYILSFYSTVYKATDIDEVVADLYMDSPENLSIVSDPGSLSETVALPNNQVNDRQSKTRERETELLTEAYTCPCLRIEKTYTLSLKHQWFWIPSIQWCLAVSLKNEGYYRKSTH